MSPRIPLLLDGAVTGWPRSAFRHPAGGRVFTLRGLWLWVLCYNEVFSKYVDGVDKTLDLVMFRACR